MNPRILFVSGQQADVNRLQQMLRSLPVVLEHVSTLREAKGRVEKGRYDVILTEALLQDGNWVDVLQLARAIPGEVQVIVTDPHADSRFWAEALNLGAYDLVTQPFYEPEVRRILYNACTRLGGSQAIAAV